MDRNIHPVVNTVKEDGVELRDLVSSDIQQVKTLIEGKIDVLQTLIDANNKRYEERFVANDLATKQAFDTSQTALVKSENTAEKRNDAVYVTLAAQQKALSEVIGRSEFSLSNKNADDKYGILAKVVSDIQILMPTLMTTNAYETRHTELQRQVTDLRDSRNELQGKGAGANALWGYIMGALGVVIAIISLLIKFLV